MSSPDLSTLAQASEASYSKDEAPVDYNKIYELSTPDISTYKHKVEPHYLISHRGTDLADKKTIGKDLKQDLRILVGDKSNSKFLNDRTKQTEKIVNSIKDKDKNSMIHLTGHSLGGHSAQQAMIDSKVVRDNVSSLDTFNAGSSPFKVGKPLDKKDPVYKQIARKSTHHVISGDGISAGVKDNMIGKVNTYKSKVKPSISQKVLDFVKPLTEKSKLGKLAHLGATRLLETLQSHSLKNFI
jgi:hypothetical protein